MTTHTPTSAEARALPLTVSMTYAARLFGISPTTAYRAHREGRPLPFPVIRAGKRLLVTRAALLAALGIDDEPNPSRDER